MIKRLSVILLVLTAFVLVTPVASATGENTAGRFEYNTTAGNATFTDIQASSSAAQTFTASSTHDVSYIRIYGYISGSPSYLKLELRNVDDSGEPDDLVYDHRDWVLGTRHTSTATLSDTYFTSGNGSWIEFELDHTVTLEEDEQYAIVLKASAGTAAHLYKWRYGGNTSSTEGMAYTSINDGDTWDDHPTNDYMFEVWGQSRMFFESNSGINVYNSFREEGDWLIVAAIENRVTPYYDTKDDIEKYFRLQLIQGNSTGAAGVSIAESVLRRWDAAPASIYINADDAAVLQWGGNFTLRILPTYSSSFYVEQSLNSTHWIGDVLDQLDRWCIGHAKWFGIENYEDKDNYTASAGSGEVLNDDGMSLFNEGIPGLSEERGQYIYQSFVVGEGISLEPGSASNPVLQSKYDPDIQLGTTLVDALTDFGDPFNLNGNTVGLAVILALYVAVVGSSFPIGHGTAGSIAGLFIIMIGMITGLVNVVWVLLAGIVVLIFVLRQLLLTTT